MQNGIPPAVLQLIKDFKHLRELQTRLFQGIKGNPSQVQQARALLPEIKKLETAADEQINYVLSDYFMPELPF